MKIATVAMLLRNDGYFIFDFWFGLSKNIYLYSTYSPNRYRTTTLDTLGLVYKLSYWARYHYACTCLTKTMGCRSP